MKHRLLVIEDDPVYAESLALLLGRRFQIETVSDAQRGLERLAACGFDALILDLDLPPALAGGGPEEGMTAARRIRESIGPRLPIAILTREVPEYMLSALQGLVDVVLSKSTPIDVVENRLMPLLQKRREG